MNFINYRTGNSTRFRIELRGISRSGRLLLEILTKSIALFLILGTLGPLNQSHALDFKGIELSKPLDEEKVLGTIEKMFTNLCYTTDDGKTCDGTTSVGGEYGQVTIFVDTDDLVYLIITTFNSDNYDAVNSALVNKFGPKAKNTEFIVSNRMGAKAKNLQREWSVKQCKVELRKYFRNLDNSAVIYQCPTPARQRALQIKRQKAEKDI